MKVYKRKQNQYDCIISTPIGKLGMVVVGRELTKIGFLSSKLSLVAPKNAIARRMATKIKRYFCNPKLGFDFVPKASGTLLQKKIWRMLQKIPSGQTMTYGELARKIMTSPRVIGNACRLNPLPIIIPCHRVVAAKGIGGYCGTTKSRIINIKKWLLNHENKK